MRNLVFCCLSVFFFMACGEKAQDVMGYWDMELEGDAGVSYSVRLPDDTICTSGLWIKQDTIYMQVKNNGIVVKSEFIGKYKIRDNQFSLIDRYGKRKECEFTIDDDIMVIRDKDDPDKIIMRLRRIKK